MTPHRSHKLIFMFISFIIRTRAVPYLGVGTYLRKIFAMALSAAHCARYILIDYEFGKNFRVDGEFEQTHKKARRCQKQNNMKSPSTFAKKRTKSPLLFRHVFFYCLTISSSWQFPRHLLTQNIRFYSKCT